MLTDFELQTSDLCDRPPQPRVRDGVGDSLLTNAWRKAVQPDRRYEFGLDRESIRSHVALVDKLIREILFEPLRKGNLSAIVPDLVFKTGDKGISAPAQIARYNDQFEFTLHFNTGRPPPEIQALHGGVLSKSDCSTVHGQINGEIAFHCDDVFPPSTMTRRSRGTSITVLHSHRMHLMAESTDQMTSEEVDLLIGRKPGSETQKEKTFYAHVIFHGPKLLMHDAGTTATTKQRMIS